VAMRQHNVSCVCHGLQSALNRCTEWLFVTIPNAVTIQFDLLKMSMVLLETCRGLQCNIYYYRINKLCIKLVTETRLKVFTSKVADGHMRRHTHFVRTIT
jgi:hypothetical protein